MLRVFIGYDPRQPLAYHVAAHSVLARASKPVAITPLVLSALPITRRGLTEFTYSRFLVPYLSNFEGVSLFMDADMLCLADISDLFAYDDTLPVAVVNHERRPFERPSLMLFRNDQCRGMTPAFVEHQSNKLFDFAWASGISLGIDPAWNHLVGYDEPRPDAKIVHFTQGLPIWKPTKDCEYAEAWRTEANRAFSSCSFEELMGRSVHPTARLVGARG